LQAIAAAQATFVSRGDRSGTNAAELRLWKIAGQTPDTLGKEKWYRDIGGGMGQALNAASAMSAYTLTDRGTWLSFNNREALIIAVEGDGRLINRYDVIELSRESMQKQNLVPPASLPTGCSRRTGNGQSARSR
jgi:tungstate transport system substrate-binding protein